MAVTPKFVQTNTFYLSGSGVVIGATSLSVTSLTDIYGNVLTMADFSTKGYGTLEPDTTNEEAFTFTGVVANANGTYTLTGVSTALAKSPYTETSGLARAHAGGTKMVISDSAPFWANIKAYMDGLAIAGAANATTILQGLLQLATGAQVLAKSATGSTGAALAVTPDLLASTLLSDYKVDTGAANAYAIAPVPAITAYTNGQIFSFKAVNPNTTASTFNVNGLGVKTIKKEATIDLVSGDIVAGQIVLVEYDGTNFQLLSLPSPSKSVATAVVANSGSATKNLADATAGTTVIAHGLGVTPTRVRIKACYQGSAGLVTAEGVFMNAKYTSMYSFDAANVAIANYVSEVSTTYVIKLADGAGNGLTVQTATVAVDATNITLTWTKAGSPTGTITFLWEADGYSVANVIA